MAELMQKHSVLRQLRQAAFSELACQFAQFIERSDNTNDDLIVYTGALVSEAVSHGHVCLNLAQTGQQDSLLDELLPQSVDEWVSRLRQSRLVGQPGDLTPLVLTDSGLLYLYRYWQDERLVALAIRQRLHTMPIVDEERLKQDFSQWQSTKQGIDWQKVAVLMALTRQFCVISGGPGTGKTTIVLKLLELFFNQSSDMRIALAAPTGKAAARLQQAISSIEQQVVEAKTLHRLLGITSNKPKGRYSADRPLPVDVLIIDEASMIDITLMAKLIKALPSSTRLVLLGDSQQLASVESGAILASICQGKPNFSETFSQQVTTYTGMNLQEVAMTSTLVDSVVQLQHSYRFDEHSQVGQLASKVKQGDDYAVIEYLSAHASEDWQQRVERSIIQQRVMVLYTAFFEAIRTHQTAETCLRLFEQSRVLCALKQGPESVETVNYLIERALAKQTWRTHQRFYHGRPIMITQNDYRQSLFNGDTGLILYDEKGRLAACFNNGDSLRWLALNRLPAHETAYAMTVHKSQGSEFDRVCILLPTQLSPLLNRELLYTAITRAKQHVAIMAQESVLRQTIVSKHEREMGLINYLN